MKYINEFESFIAEAKRSIKKYSEVKIGDIAEENPAAGGKWEGGVVHGKVVWKGNEAQLRKSKYADTIEEWEDMDPGVDFDEYDLVVVEHPKWGETLMNYDNDPSGAVVFKK